MKHKIEPYKNSFVVKEKRGFLSSWKFVDAGGFVAYDGFSECCVADNEDHAQRIIDYRLKHYK